MQLKKKTKKKNSKDNKKLTTIKEKQFLVEDSYYNFNPSYFEHNGKIATLLRLYVDEGSNRNMSYQEVMDFLPTYTLDDVEIHFITKDRLVKGDEKSKLIKDNTNKNKDTIVDTEKESEKAREDDKSKKEERRAIIQDYNDYELIANKTQPIVVFRWEILIIGPSVEIIEEQIEQIKLSLDKNHSGASWMSTPGDQRDNMEKLFAPIEKSRLEMTSTASNYAGLNLTLNSGLRDPKGIPIGQDALSLTGATSCFDFENSTVNQAVILTPTDANVPLYLTEDFKNSPSASSVIAQAAANNICIAGNRVHHIVLNNFNYFKKGLYYRFAETVDIFKEYDVNKVTINPLQGFGSIEQVIEIYNRLRQKLVNIFNILCDLNLTPDQQGILESVIENYYIKQRYWTADADIRPGNTRIVNITNPENYGTLSHLLSQFTIESGSAIKQNRENKADNTDTLRSKLNTALSSYTAVLGRPTSIEETDAPQVYYSFRNIASDQLRQIQFLNLLEYIVHTAKKGDCIIIHGYDKILAEVSKMAHPAIQAAINNGIRFIYAFDHITSPNTKDGKMNDLFEMNGLYYTDLDIHMDWSMIGRLSPDEVVKVQKLLNTPFSMTITAQLQAKLSNQVLVHRKVGDVNNFVRLKTII